MVAKLFLRFPQLAKGSPEQVEAYSRDLARFPEWAISHGIANIISGLVLKAPEFPPTSLQVQQAVAEAMQPSLDEARLISDVLTARIEAENPEMEASARKQIADAARAAMRKNAPEDTFDVSRPHPKLRSKFDENRMAACDGPLHISDTLAAKLGIDRREQREDVA